MPNNKCTCPAVLQTATSPVFNSPAISTAAGLSSPSLSLLQHVLNESFASLVATSDEWPGSTVQEAHVQCSLSPHLKHVGRHILMNSHVSLRRSHVLPECDHIHTNVPQLSKCSPQLFLCLAQAQHNRSLCDQVFFCSFRSFQHTQTLSKVARRSRTWEVSSSTVSTLCA